MTTLVSDPVGDDYSPSGALPVWPFLGWAFYIGLSPLYLWKSGLPQVSDFILLLVIGAYFLSIPVKVAGSIRKPLSLLMAFLLVVWLVSIVQAIIYRPEMLMDPLRLSYNCVVFFFVSLLAKRAARRLLWFSLIGVILAYMVILAGGVQVGAGRQDGTFNNPNQMAYMGVLSLALVTLAYWNNLIRTFFAISLFIFIAYLSLLGLSFAAVAVILASLAIFTFSIISRGARITNRGLIRILISVVILLFSTLSYHVVPAGSQARQFITEQLVDPVAYRFQRRAEQRLESKIEGLAAGDDRGFSVFKEHPENIIWGVGRGGNERFGHKNELHASLPAILYSFGLIGFSLFCVAFWHMHRNGGFRAFLLSLPVWAWSFAHYGLNFPLFWGLMAMFAAGATYCAENPGRPRKKLLNVSLSSMMRPASKLVRDDA